MGRFSELLNHLRVTTDDIDNKDSWEQLPLGILQTSEGVRHMSHRHWKLLVDLVTSESESKRVREILVDVGVRRSEPRYARNGLTYNPRILAFIARAQGWSKLERWMVTVWILWPLGAGVMAELDLGLSMKLLFHQQPGAAQELEQPMEQWSQRNYKRIPESFQKICRQA